MDHIFHEGIWIDPEISPSLLLQRIARLHLTKKITRHLQETHIQRIGDLVQVSASDLVYFGFDSIAQRKIRNALHRKGLELNLRLRRKFRAALILYYHSVVDRRLKRKTNHAMYTL